MRARAKHAAQPTLPPEGVGKLLRQSQTPFLARRYLSCDYCEQEARFLLRSSLFHEVKEWRRRRRRLRLRRRRSPGQPPQQPHPLIPDLITRRNPRRNMPAINNSAPLRSLSVCAYAAKMFALASSSM